MANKNDEQILVLDKKPFNDLELIEDMLETDILESLSIGDSHALNKLLDGIYKEYGSTGRRGDMETNTNYLQPIPYIIIKKGNEYFTYTRLNNSGEERLHDKVSFGVGGHMNPVDGLETFKELLAENAKRELSEEVKITDSNDNEVDYGSIVSKLSVSGLIYSEDTDVDSVHLAIVYLLDLDTDYNVVVKETDKLKGEFKTKEQIKDLNLETWSNNALKVLK